MGRVPSAVLLGVVALSSLVPLNSLADQDSGRWAVCGDDGFPQPFVGAASPADVPRVQLPARLDADFAESDPLSITLRGSALVERGDQRVIADKMTFNRETNLLTAEGSIRFDQQDVTIFGERAQLNIDTDEGEVSAATYYLHSGHIRGSAENAYTAGDGTASFRGVTFTTCATRSKAWEMRASEIELDPDAGVGEAWHATFRVQDVPVFYTPYLSFPLDDRRKSGLLVPRWGDSDVNGVDITLPWYWNIAPNYDFTFLPRYMAKRGLMLGGEFRYLGQTFNGSLFGSYLNNDQESGSNRWAASVRHNYRPLPRWSASIDYNKVSDDRYLEDFGNSIRFSSVAQLNQRGDVTYQGDGWSARGRVVKFQNVDPAITERRKPYERVPDFTINGRWPNQLLGLTYGFLGDATWFEHSVKVDGARALMVPSVSYPFLRPWGFAKPKLSLNYTSYSLNNNNRGSDSITRTAPVVSLDSGLFFERPLKWGGEELVQTLEPRLFYLYVPFKDDQGEIPRFDTNNVSQSYNFLFREYRFTGPDRLGDANQLTTAISTRFLRSGRELMNLSVGQIQYFSDRKVTISGVTDRRSRSDLIAEGTLNFAPRWSVRAGINWDTFENRTVKGRADVRYNPQPGKLVNFGYRYTLEDLEQTDLSGTWPLSRQWRFMGRWHQSIRDQRLLELIMGLEYQDCCWAVRLAGRRYRNGTADPDLKNAIFFEVELKGLAGIGTNLTNLFSDRIPGYVSDY